MNDPRVEAAAIALAEHTLNKPWSKTFMQGTYRVRAVRALTAADAADREQGIHRVRVDEATVERVYAEISHNLTPVIGRNRLRDRDGEQPEPLRPHIEAAARAVLTALTGAES